MQSPDVPPMAGLTENEKFVMDALRHRRTAGDGVRTFQVAASVLHLMGYDSVVKALRSLVSKGLLSKPRRGYYLLTEEGR